MMFFKINSDFLKPGSTNKSIYTFLRLYQTHYEVLNLPPNCTAKQIKNAYIKLSKEYHPDVNRSTQSHVKFQQISEAYKVLGKVDSRRNYDLGLAGQDLRSRGHSTDPNYYHHFGRNPYNDPSFWANRDRRRDQYYQNRSYYGIDGVPRLSNGTILMFCVFFSLVGLGMQYIAITKSMTFKRDALVRKSQEAEMVLNETRKIASTNGNAEQLAILKTRLLGDDK